MKTSSVAEEREGDATAACAGGEPVARLLGKTPQVRASQPAGQES